MSIQEKSPNKLALILLVIVLLLTGIACQYAGEILPSAEATQRALPSATPTSDFSLESKFKEGDDAVVVGGTYGALVPLFSEPAGLFFTSQIMNNSETVIMGFRIVDTDTWYQIDGMTGGGWIKEDNLKFPGE